MKNRKSKIVNLFKIGTFLLSFSLLLFNCEKQDEILSKQTNYKEGIIKGEYINLNKLKNTNLQVLSKIEKIQPHKSLKKSTENTDYGFSINTTKILVLRKENYTSYTFEAYKRNTKENKLYNFVLTDYKKENYSQCLIGYPIKLDGTIDIVNTEIEIIKDKSAFSKGVECGPYFVSYEDEVNCIYTQCTAGGKHYWDDRDSCKGDATQLPTKTCDTVVTIVEYSTCGGGVDYNNTEVNGENITGEGTNSSGTNSTENTEEDPTNETTTAPVYLLPASFSKSLTLEEIQWLNLEENTQIKNEIAFFLDTNKNPDNTYPEETTSFAELVVKMLAENPDLSIDDIDFEDHLIDNTNNPCVTAIIKELQKKDIRNALVPDLEGMGHLSQMVLDLFDHSKKYNLTFNIGQLNNIGSNVNGNTSGFDITLDTDLVKDATQLFIAKTVIHESLHAFIHYTVRENPGSIMTNVLKKYHTFYIINNPNNAGNLSEHQFMSQYVEALAYSLSSYDNHQQPMDYYKALSWAGLESSNAYNALPDKTNIEKIIENERLAKSDAKSTKCP